MKSRIIILLLLVASWQGYSQSKIRQTHRFKSEQYSVSYQTLNGRIDGEYKSFYPDGTPRAEGLFENNYRRGMWTMRDSTGELVVKRNYSGPFTYIDLSGNAGPARPQSPLDDSEPLGLSYNDDGYIDFFPVEEKDVVFAKRLLRSVPLEANPIMGADDLLFHTLQSTVSAGIVTAYDPEGEVFRDTLSFSNLNTDSFQLTGFELVEDAFYVNTRKIMETRIIGISPVVINRFTGQRKLLYMIYYPESRKSLAAVNIADSSIPAHVRTLDDLFFFRCLSGQIIKEENVYDRYIADYASGKELLKEAERIEISLIEMEHELWLHGSPE